MPKHTAVQGDCLSSLAASFGFPGWEQLYNHPANAELKKKRPNPNILAPGDEVFLPQRDQKTLPIGTGVSHKFIVNLKKVRLRIILADRSGKPYQGKRFIVNAGMNEVKGTTTSQGMVEAQVLATESTARLRAWLLEDSDEKLPTIDRPVAIGHIDPIELNSGIQGRLTNLGYTCPITNEIDEQLLSAARCFRATHGLPDIPPPSQDSDSPGGSDSSQARPDAAADDDEAIATYAGKLLDDAFRSKLLAVYESSPAS